MGGCASKDKKDKVVDGDANNANATENTADGDKASAATTTEANGDATTNAEGCVFLFSIIKKKKNSFNLVCDVSSFYKFYFK